MRARFVSRVPLAMPHMIGNWSGRCLTASLALLKKASPAGADRALVKGPRPDAEAFAASEGGSVVGKPGCEGKLPEVGPDGCIRDAVWGAIGRARPIPEPCGKEDESCEPNAAALLKDAGLWKPNVALGMG